jgi:outer membrane protein
VSRSLLLMKHTTHGGEILFPSILLPITAIALFGLFFLAPVLDAQNLKVAVISMQKALATTQEGQKASRDLAAKVNPKQQEFNGRQQELKDLEAQLNRGAVLADEKKAELTKEIDSKKRRLDRDMQDADQALRTEQQQIVQKLGQRLVAVITKYAKDNNYTLVLEAGDANSQVLFAAPGTDITDAVVSLYDKTYANQTPAPPPVRP